jgi:hypothetical protein
MADESGLLLGTPLRLRDTRKGDKALVLELPFDPVGAHQFTTGTVAQTLTPPSGATLLMLQARDLNVLITFDGTDPVSATKRGFLIPSNAAPMILPVGANTNFRVLLDAGAVLNYQWGTL